RTDVATAGPRRRLSRRHRTGCRWQNGRRHHYSARRRTRGGPVTATRRVRSEFTAAWNSFLRRRTAVFFTFFFPVLLIVIFGVLVGSRPTGGGLFAKAPGYYVPGYLAVVVLFTPLSRVGSTVARYRDGNRFEKL